MNGFHTWWQGWLRELTCMTTVQGKMVKGQNHKVRCRIGIQKLYNSAVYDHINFNVGGNYRRGGRRLWYNC